MYVAQENHEYSEIVMWQMIDSLSYIKDYVEDDDEHRAELREFHSTLLEAGKWIGNLTNV
tara:strand:+ start:1620 stop:1799 length:180 start_codon:yes stop_codon:yes gene_type:complete